jgi:hypothetical protein
MPFVDFINATFRAGSAEAENSRGDASLLGSVVHRPAIFRRNGIAWAAACAWRGAARVDDLAAFKRAKRELDERIVGEAGELMATLIRQLHSNRPADGVTCVPCGHSRRADCFGKQLAQSVADAFGLPFLPIFADRFCSGVSHPKEYAKLPPLQQIADPLPTMLIIDDLAVSGWHLEEWLLALRSLHASASAMAWISGSLT